MNTQQLERNLIQLEDEISRLEKIVIDVVGKNLTTSEMSTLQDTFYWLSRAQQNLEELESKAGLR